MESFKLKQFLKIEKQQSNEVNRVKCDTSTSKGDYK